MMTQRSNDALKVGMVAGATMSVVVYAVTATSGDASSLFVTNSVGQTQTAQHTPVLLPSTSTRRNRAFGPSTQSPPRSYRADANVNLPKATFVNDAPTQTAFHKITTLVGFLAVGVASAAFALKKMSQTDETVAMFASAATKDYYGPDRKKWLPGADIPSYLTGEFPGDYGFDPMGLASPENPGNFARYREAEVLHGRWAMLGIVGCLVPEFLGVGNEPVWFKAGSGLFEGGIDYLGNPGLIHAQSIFAIIIFQVLLMGGAEAYRTNSDSDLDPIYPGGPFDPLGYAGSGDDLALAKVKEIKNGRLAMVSMVGYYAQACSTHVGPLENWTAHLGDPFGVNVLSTPLAMFATAATKDYYGPDRKKWLPGADIPSYLTGEFPGDYGFDPMGLASPENPGNFARYREAEVLHGRWAMLGIVGCLVPEFLGVGNEPVWFKAGSGLFEGGIDYLGNPGLIHAQSIFAIIIFQVLLMGGAEAYRTNSDSDLDPIYPGGPFDPLGYAGSGDDLALAKVKEIKNGRLAMVSMVGYYAQACSTHVGPLENWSAHLGDPFGVNVLADFAMF